MHGARASADWTSSAATNPRRLDDRRSAERRDRGEHGVALGPVAEDHAAQAGHARARPARPPRTTLGARFSGISRPANTTSGSVRTGAGGSSGPAYSPAQHGHLAAQPLLAQARGVQLREAEGALAHPRAAALHRDPDPPPARPRYSRQ